MVPLHHCAAVLTLACVLGLSALSQKANADGLSDSGITETGIPKLEQPGTVPGGKEDTLVPSSQASQRPHYDRSSKLYSDDNRSGQSQAFREAVSHGKGMTTTGIVLHFLGLGLGTVATAVSYSSPSNSNSAAQLVLDLVGTGLEITGPIFSCAGASGVQEAAQKAGFEPREDLKPWKDYGSGWSFTGAGIGMVLVGDLIAVGSSGGSSNSSGAAIVAIPIMICGVVFIIVGEVKWIQCLVHAKIITGQFDEGARKPSWSWNVSPYVDMHNHGAGVALNANF